MDSQENKETTAAHTEPHAEAPATGAAEAASTSNSHGDSGSSGKPPKKSKKKLILLAASIFVVTGVGVSTYFFVFKGKAKAVAHHAKAGAHDKHGKAEHGKIEHGEAAHAEHGETAHAEHGEVAHGEHAEAAQGEPAHGEHAEPTHDADHAKASHGEATHDAEPAHGADHAKSDHAEAALPEYKGFFGRYLKAFHDVQAKVDAVQAAEEKSARLVLENASLRVWVESLQFNCQIKRAEDHTKETAHKLYEDTGSEVGRTLANIRYRPPAQLLPVQLYTLGVSYFKAREDEKAAVILTFLSEMEDQDIYQSPKNLLMAGVSWYRLENYTLADQYFNRVLAHTEKEKEREIDSGENLPFFAQARLWKGLVSRRLGKATKSQFWLRQLVDHHPRSVEASWINSRRGLAAEQKAALESTAVEGEPESEAEEVSHE